MYFPPFFNKVYRLHLSVTKRLWSFSWGYVLRKNNWGGGWGWGAGGLNILCTFVLVPSLFLWLLPLCFFWIAKYCTMCNFTLFLPLPATLGIPLPAPSTPTSHTPPAPFSPSSPVPLYIISITSPCGHLIIQAFMARWWLDQQVCFLNNMSTNFLFTNFITHQFKTTKVISYTFAFLYTFSTLCFIHS